MTDILYLMFFNGGLTSGLRIKYIQKMIFCQNYENIFRNLEAESVSLIWKIFLFCNLVNTNDNEFIGVKNEFATQSKSLVA